MSDRLAVRSELHGSVLVLILDRGSKANTLTPTDMAWIADSVAGAVTDDAVRAVLIRAEGDHFCGGADLVAVNSPDARPRTGATMRMLNSAAHRMVQSIWDCTLPTVAAVQGRAAGVGLHLALATDFVVAADSASFQEPFRERGFTADSGATFLLPRLIGLARAKELLLLGRTLTAADALTWGLISQVHHDDELGAESFALAEELAAGPTFSMELTKSMLNKHVTTDLASSMSEEAAIVQLSLHGQDFKEGIKAFRERRPAEFTGR